MRNPTQPAPTGLGPSGPAGPFRAQVQALTPQRIHNRQIEVNRAARSATTILAGGAAVILLIASFFGRPPWTEFRLGLLSLVLALPGFTWLGLTVLQRLEWLVHGWPNWVECGDQLSYSTTSGVHSVDWSRVTSIEFQYEHVYQGDDPLPHTAYTTFLLIVLDSRKKLRLMIHSSNPNAAMYTGIIVRILLDQLQEVAGHGRRSAAHALGSFGPKGIGVLQKTIKTAEHDNLREDAANALQKIEEAVPYLQGAANDHDEAVRTAATEALRRLEVVRDSGASRC